MKQLAYLFLLTLSFNAFADWVEYSVRENGDVYFFDDARVQKDGNETRVWNRIRYKTSVMGAASYQSLLLIDCIENLESTLQSTFYSDKDWTTPAMATNKKPKPAKAIKTNSATQELAKIVCK